MQIPRSSYASLDLADNAVLVLTSVISLFFAILGAKDLVGFANVPVDLDFAEMDGFCVTEWL